MAKKIKSVGTISEFLTGDYKIKQHQATGETLAKVLTATSAGMVLLVPDMAFANELDDTFGRIHEKILLGLDMGVVLVIIFAGAAWGLGHKQKGIEILIGVSCGYILARHAVDIRDFLKSI